MTSSINASTAAGGGVITTADASGILALQTAGTTAVTIDGSQNVGIGTSSPTAKLDVSGATWVRGGQKVAGYLNPLVGDGYNVTFGISSNTGYIQSYNGTATNALSIDGNSIAFRTGTFTTAATIDSSGNVGIGTSSPNAKLNVKTLDGTQLAMIAGTTIGTRYTSDASGVYIEGTDPTGGSSYQPLYTGGSIFGVRISGTERMRIDSSGNLLLGQTTAAGAQTGGGTYFRAAGVAGSSSILISHVSGTSNGNSFAEFFTGSTQAGAIVQNTTSTVNYNTSSDYRLKENVQPMADALAKVIALKPCTYTWKVDGAAGQGFIAHELQAVVPDCVTGEKDAVDADGNPVYQGIDTSFLVATLTAAIQEQQAIIQQLTARIETLEAK